MKPFMTALATGIFLLASACSSETEAQQAAPPVDATAAAQESPESSEPTEEQEPTEESRPPTEAELVAWIESRKGFDKLAEEKDEDPREYLNEQALRAYDFFCSELRKTALPSEVFEKGLEMALGADAIWGDVYADVSYYREVGEKELESDLWRLSERRLIQYEAATTIRCSQHSEAFSTWADSYRS